MVVSQKRVIIVVAITPNCMCISKQSTLTQLPPQLQTNLKPQQPKPETSTQIKNPKPTHKPLYPEAYISETPERYFSKQGNPINIDPKIFTIGCKRWFRVISLPNPETSQFLYINLPHSRAHSAWPWGSQFLNSGSGVLNFLLRGLGLSIF